MTKFGFTQFSIQEFEQYIKALKVGRTIFYIQQHHTYSPDYKLFKNNNHFELQRGMKNYHLSISFSDIAQHFTTFPDGSIETGRSLENTPAGIYGFNSNAICIEHLGNFDAGCDLMTPQQSDTIVKMTAILANKFSIDINTDKIVYHHWFDLRNGHRNNGSGYNKSCPGTNFFGGNKVEDCNKNFIPLVKNYANGIATPSVVAVAEYRIITATTLNVRLDAKASASKATRDPLNYGSVVRVFAEKDGWYKISSSAQHWIYGKYTQEVKRATVNASTLNVRNGIGSSYSKVDSIYENEEVFIVEEKNDWSKIGLDNKWVKSSYLTKK